MALNRRDLLTRTGAAGVGLVAAGVLPSPTIRCSAMAQDAVGLSVWKAPHTPDDQTYFDEQLAAYAGAHPGVEAEFRVTPWETWQETYTAAFAGRDPPDVCYMTSAYFPRFADAGTLVDLGTLGVADLSVWEPLFDPAIWNLGTRAGAVYGLPFLQSGISFIWNKTLFRDAGLDPEAPPATWEELTVMARSLTKDDGSQWGYAIMDNSTGEMRNFVAVPIVNYGGPLATGDEREWLAAGEGYAQGLQLQIDMIRTDKTAPPLGAYAGHDVDVAFLDGKIAMQLSYASFLEPLLLDYPDFEMGVGMPPAGPEIDLSLGEAGYWMMAEQSGHKSEAWAMMEYLSGAQVIGEYALLSRLFLCRTDVNPFEGDALATAFAETQRHYMRLPALPFDYWSILMPEIEAALNGQTSAMDALAVSAERINQLIQEGG